MTGTMESKASLVVTTTTPPDWNSWVEHSAPTLRSNWIALASHRLMGGLVVFAERGATGLELAVGGTVLDRAGSNPRLDPYRILSGDSRQDGLLPDGPYPWGEQSEESLFPCLYLMLPNYETTVIGPHRDDPERLDAFCADIEEWAREQGCRSVAASYLLPEPRAFIDVLRHRGWFVATMTHRCDLVITWNDREEYLATLPSKRRIEARREMKALSDQGVRIEPVSVSDCDLDDLLGLRLQLLEKYLQPGDPAREQALLRRLIEHFDDHDLTVFTARVNGHLLGFTLMVRDGSTWVALMTGTDYTHAGWSYSYFGTAYYEPAALGPACGITRISYGIGSWAAKRRRGCRLTPLHIAATSFGSP